MALKCRIISIKRDNSQRVQVNSKLMVSFLFMFGVENYDLALVLVF